MLVYRPDTSVTVVVIGTGSTEKQIRISALSDVMVI